jgi:selenocysteine lyase/cysteine desulfurase
MVGLSDKEYQEIVSKDVSYEELPGAVRASFSFYNNLHDADRALTAIEDLSRSTS